MIDGAHMVIFSENAEADRTFFRDVLGFPPVDVGEGWLIFGLPPAEVAVHPAPGNGRHEFFLMTPDVAAFVREMKAKGIPCGDIDDQDWGLLTRITLPGGGEIGIYEPRHARPPAMPGPE